MVKLSKRQLEEKRQYAFNYMKEGNSASKSLVDANANLSCSNVVTLAGELNKDTDMQINRYVLGEKVQELFGKKAKKEYYRSLERHEIYSGDETSIFNRPYCVSIDLHPFIESGMIPIGGDSLAPTHLYSFCGSYINLIFAISSNFAGAVADCSFLTYFNYFAVKDYGENYLETHTSEIENALQHVVYSINQPGGVRNFQSCFWNISIYDSNYFDALFGKVLMPNGETPNWEQVKKFQVFFMKWFNKERTKALLTFPVVSAAALTKDGKMQDIEFKEFLAEEMSEGNSFFHYNSDSVDSLASCCRLRNAIDTNQFSFTLGTGGLATGSKKVFTINVNRLVQDGRDIEKEIEKVHRYLIAYNEILYQMKDAKMLPVYDAGYISLEKQYLTIGLNGIVEACEYLGYDISYNKPYLKWIQGFLSKISETNKKGAKHYSEKFGHKIMFNTELVPAENIGVKFSRWDRKDGYKVNRECYNSYLYKVEDDSIDFVDKFKIHGKETLQYLDGGSCCHQNFQESPSKGTWLKIMDQATFYGCNYWCPNIRSTCCEDCGYISKKDLLRCPKCGSSNVSYATRIIGYLKKIKSFSAARQKEAGLRFYHKI